LHEALHVKIQVFWGETLSLGELSQNFKGAVLRLSAGSSNPRRIALWQMRMLCRYSGRG